jgi:hypothetical protein
MFFIALNLPDAYHHIEHPVYGLVRQSSACDELAKRAALARAARNRVSNMTAR